jgi:hypothetical protein
MSDVPIAPYPDAKTVYRALRSKNWVDPVTHRLKPDAFLRRTRESGKDRNGLSVSPISAEHAQSPLSRRLGAASLEVGAVRQLNAGLDVIPDRPDHANITGVPYPDEDPMLAEHVARLLRDIARYPASASDINTSE